MSTNEPADTESLPEELDRMIGALADPGLPADGVVDLAFELADLAQQAALDLELAGKRDEATGLYDRLARMLREAAAARPEDERALVESIAEFWALSAESWRTAAQPAETAHPATKPQPAAKLQPAERPQPEPRARATGFQVLDRRARPWEQPRPGPVRSPVQPSVARTEPFEVRARLSVTTGPPRAPREAAAQRVEDRRQWLQMVRTLTQSQVSTTAISGELKKPTVSKGVARTLSSKGSK